MVSAHIRVSAFASLQKNGRRLRSSASFRTPRSPDADRHQGIPEDEASIVLTNGKRSGLDDELHEGDEVRLFPLIGGG